MKIIFAGTPDIAAAVLQSLINAKHHIVACLTQPDRPQGRGLKLTPSPVKQVAMQHEITVLQPSTLKDLNVQQQLRDLQADVMIVLAYGLILPQAVLNIPKLGCINIHASILPRWRGAAPIQHAILAGDKQTGITIMQMDAGLDTGNMLAIYPCDIATTDTSASLFQKLTALAQTSILDSLEKLTAGKLIPQLQDNDLATYAHKLEKQQAKIDWQQSAIDIDRCIRAYNPWPVAFTSQNDQIIRIWQAEIVIDAISTATAGTIIAIDPKGIQVNTGDGVIRLLTLQLPSKKAIAAIELCRAHPEFKVGAQFE